MGRGVRQFPGIDWGDPTFRAVLRRKRRESGYSDGIVVTIRETAINQILDRWDEAYESGICYEIDDPTTFEKVLIVKGGFYRASHIISPKDYPLQRATPRKPTNTAPGSPSRIEEYARRLASGEDLHRTGDQNDLADAVIVERLNGMGRRVLGRSGELT